jgi:plasmid stabilization system protein ParE
MKFVEYSRVAAADIHDLGDYIAMDDTRAADASRHWFDRLAEFASRVGPFPCRSSVNESRTIYSENAFGRCSEVLGG